MAIGALLTGMRVIRLLELSSGEEDQLSSFYEGNEAERFDGFLDLLSPSAGTPEGFTLTVKINDTPPALSGDSQRTLVVAEFTLLEMANFFAGLLSVLNITGNLPPVTPTA